MFKSETLVPDISLLLTVDDRGTKSEIKLYKIQLRVKYITILSHWLLDRDT